MEVLYKGQIGKDGKLRFYDLNGLNEMCSKIPNTKVEIIVRKEVTKTSNKQVGYFYAEVLPKVHKGLVDLGNCYSLSQVEDFINREFFLVEEIKEDYSGIKQTAYTIKDIPKHIFSESLEKLIRFSSETLSILISEPRKQ